MSLIQELLIKIGIKSDTTGGDKAADTIDKVDKSAKGIGKNMGSAATSSKDLAGALGKNVEVGSQAVTMMTSLEGASKGGAAGLASAFRAGLAFFTMLRGAISGAGGIGIAITVIAALAGGLFALVKAFREPTESLEDFKKRLAELDKANLKQLEATLSALDERLKSNKEHADAVRASLDKIDDAEMAAKLAAVKNSGLSDADKQTQELLIRDEFRQRKDTRERAALEGNVRDSTEKRNELAKGFNDARERLIELKQERDEQVGIRREIRQIDEENAAEYKRVQQSIKDGTYTGASPERDARQEQSFARRRELKKQLLSEDAAAKLEAEHESARKAFEGENGEGGIQKQYNAEVAALKKATAALNIYLETKQKVAEWEKAQLRIENNGTDPRDTEAANRASPGKARIVGPDGKVVEYDVQAPATTRQKIDAIAEAAKAGPVAPEANTIKRGGGSLPGDGQAAKGITKPLQETTKAIGDMDTGDDTAKAAEALQQATEEAAQAQREFGEATAAALGEATAAQQQAAGEVLAAQRDTVAKLGQIAAAQNSLRSEVASLRSQIRALRVA